MKIILSNIIEIENPTDTILDYCKKDLVFNNPDYIKKQRLGFWIGKTPKTIKLYDFYDYKLYLPIGCFDDIWKIYPKKEDYIDMCSINTRTIKSNIMLREYQKPCTNALKKYVNGLFVLPAGTGKTQIALECASVLGQHTLFITHTKELLNQAKTRCEENLICSTSTITEGKSDINGDIVFATVQTLSNLVDNYSINQNEFGLIVVDECHHACSNAESVAMFEKCINYFSARYKLGLTATLSRSDGLEKTTTKILGNVIYELKKNDDKNKLIGYYENKPILEVPLNTFQIPARINFIKTTYNTDNKDIYDNSYRIVYAKLINDICGDSDRNKLILELINKTNGYTIVISERIQQLEYLSNQIKSSIYINGKTNKKIREEEIKEFKNGKYKVLFASYSLIAEGFDAPMLENLIMASPIKDKRLVIQAVGRCQRPYENKKIANVYDLVDDVSMLNRFTRARKNVYKNEGWEMR